MLLRFSWLLLAVLGPGEVRSDRCASRPGMDVAHGWGLSYYL